MTDLVGNIPSKHRTGDHQLGLLTALQEEHSEAAPQDNVGMCQPNPDSDQSLSWSK